MPELPEVETLRRSLLPSLKGRIIVSVRKHRTNLRFPLPRNLTRRLAGTRITDIARKGKYLLFHTECGDVLLVHLGMSGNLRLRRANSNAPIPPHTHVFFALERGESLLYVDPRRFGFMDLFAAKNITRNPHLAGLGRDPLCDGLDAEFLSQRLQGSRRAIKNALMDQGLIAGLGNIYCCEALFRAGISPLAEASSLASGNARSRRRLLSLLEAIDATLQDALRAGGSSIRDYLDAEGESGHFQHDFQVYDRAGEGCPRTGCKGVIRRILQANRSSFHCPRCQRR